MESPLGDVARSISVVGRERIQNATQLIALDEVLSAVPGLYMQNRYNFAQDLRVAMRGFGARSNFGIRGIKIIVDDIPETVPDGQAQVDSIDLGSAERIEVLRGPASSLYGNASGGVISVVSQLGGTEPFVEGKFAVGELGYEKYQLKAGGQVNRIDYLVNASYQEFEGYREHSASSGTMLNSKTRINFADTDSLTIALNLINQPDEQDPGGIDAAQVAADRRSARAQNVSFNAGEELSQQKLGFVYRTDRFGGDLLLRNYYVWRDFANRLPFTGGGAVDLERFSQLGGTEPFVEGQFAVGELGYEKYQLKAGGQVNRIDYLVNASYQEFEGYREHSASSGTMLNSKTRINFADTDSLTIALNLINQPDEQDPGGIDAAQVAADRRSARAQNVSFNAGEELSQQKLGFVYRTDRFGGDLLLRNYYVWRDFANRLPFTGGGAVDLERFFYGVGAQYTLTGLGSDKFDLTFGFDLDRQDDDRLRFDNNQGVLGALVFDQNEQVDSNGVYAQGTHALNEAWSINAGIRYDDLQYTVTDRFLADGDASGRRDFSEVSPSISIGYRTGSNTFFASYSSAFETPTTTELANPDGSGGFNQSIKPQKADNFEIGLRGAAQNLSYEFAIFQIDLEDELVPFELAAFPGRTFYSNAGSSSRTGVEMAMTWTLAGGFSADVSYTWSEFEFDSFIDDNGNDFSGNQLPGIPEHFGYFGFHYESDRGLTATLESVFSGKLFANTANSVSVSGYAVTNFRMSHEFARDRWAFGPYLGINNIFAEKYNSNVRINAFGGRFFEPAPTRNVYAGVVARFE